MPATGAAGPAQVSPGVPSAAASAGTPTAVSSSQGSSVAAQALTLPLLSQPVGASVAGSTGVPASSPVPESAGLGSPLLPMSYATDTATGGSPFIHGALLVLAATTIPAGSTPAATDASPTLAPTPPTVLPTTVASAVPAEIGLTVPPPTLPDSVLSDPTMMAVASPGITVGPLPSAVPEPGAFTLAALLLLAAGLRPAIRSFRQAG